MDYDNCRIKKEVSFLIKGVMTRWVGRALRDYVQNRGNVKDNLGPDN